MLHGLVHCYIKPLNLLHKINSTAGVNVAMLANSKSTFSIMCIMRHGSTPSTLVTSASDCDGVACVQVHISSVDLSETFFVFYIFFNQFK